MPGLFPEESREDGRRMSRPLLVVSVVLGWLALQGAGLWVANVVNDRDDWRAAAFAAESQLEKCREDRP
jgi:hypothetical protein